MNDCKPCEKCRHSHGDICYESIDEHVFCGCGLEKYDCPHCGSDEHQKPIGCACGNPCHKRGEHNCPYGPP